MKITNRHGAPQTLVNLLARDDYSRGPAHISVTQLIDSPRIRILREKHNDEITTDVSDMLWAMVGRALHVVAEKGADEEHLAEERLFAKSLGWTVSGAVDVQKLGPERVAITDYKFTSAWSVLNHDKTSWENQLNGYSWLIREAKGLTTDHLKIYVFVRDWSRHRVGQPGYPPTPMMTVPIRLWSLDEQDRYIADRIRLHQEGWRKDSWGDELPRCSDEERWLRSETYAVTRAGNKKPYRVVASRGDADVILAELSARDSPSQQYPRSQPWTVVIRPGEPIRCNHYCPVRDYCSQHKEYLDGQRERAPNQA